jgi:chromosome segregation ATPase
MGVEQVVNLLKIANNDLAVVEHRYERSKRDLDSIEAEIQNSARLLQELSDQIATMRKTLDQYQLSCKEQRLDLTRLQMQKLRLEGLVDKFQNNNEEYIKIRKTVEEKVHSILSDKKMLLKLAILSLSESMRKDPDKYSSLIYNNNISSNADYNNQCYTASYMYGQQQQYPAQAYMDMLIEEAERLYNKLTKELVDEIITDYSSNISSSLPLLQTPSDEKEQQ